MRVARVPLSGTQPHSKDSSCASFVLTYQSGAVVILATCGIGVHAQDSARAVAGGGIFAPGWTGKIDASEERAGQVAQQRQARAGGWRPAGDHWARGHLLESRQSRHRQLHGEGDVYRAEVHERQRPPAPVRDRHRWQRPRHGPAELSVLRGLWRRHLHRPRVRPRRVSNGWPTRRAERRCPQGRRPRASR